MKLKQRILVSPYSRQAGNAKNYPYWDDLLWKLKDEYNIIQVGVGDEAKFAAADDYKFDLPLQELEELTLRVGRFIAIDNFFHHMAYNIGVNGTVLWGPSDPLLFGYPTQNNILKSRDLLRKDQFGYYKDFKWEHKEIGWHKPEEIIKCISIA